MGPAAGAPGRGIEWRIQALYRGLGWRWLILGYVAFGWAAVAFMGLLLLLGVARVEEVSLATGLRGFLRVLLTSGIGMAFALYVSNRLIRPLRVLDTTEPVSVETWSAVMRIPVSVAWCSCLFGALCGPTGGVLAFRVIQGNRADLWVPMVLLPLCGVVAVPTGVFGLQLIMRPILRSLSQRCPAPAKLRPGVSLRHKVLLAGPAVSLALVMLAVSVSGPSGRSMSSATAASIATAVIAAVVSVPAAMQLGWSMLAPLGDLLDATERINRGDYADPVPVLSNDEYADLARSLNLAMRGLAERERLAQDNQLLLEDVRASRARLLAASDKERRRIERNLHDGAQQRLVALSYELRLLEIRASELGAPEVCAAAEAATASLVQAIAEIRELARGLHPTVLTTDGLAVALRQLASLAPIPVSVSASSERFEDTVETAAYYAVVEGLTNAVKHSSASRVSIEIRPEAGRLEVRIEDDGVGGAMPYPGSGLAGLADRVAAVNGELTINSPLGFGTVLSASLPAFLTVVDSLDPSDPA